jgi:hypothetical protein
MESCTILTIAAGTERGASTAIGNRDTSDNSRPQQWGRLSYGMKHSTIATMASIAAVVRISPRKCHSRFIDTTAR